MCDFSLPTSEIWIRQGSAPTGPATSIQELEGSRAVIKLIVMISSQPWVAQNGTTVKEAPGMPAEGGGEQTGHRTGPYIRAYNADLGRERGRYKL